MVVVHIDKAELAKNNLRILKLRKETFKKDLIRLFELGGYVFIILLYFKNTSFIRFIVRFGLHTLISDPFPKAGNMQYAESFKKHITKSLFYALLFINGIFLFLDLISGVPDVEDENQSLHGSITLQIIGDSRPQSVLSYVYYNFIIFAHQYILAYLTTLLDINEDIKSNNEVLQNSNYSINQIEGDGYTGLSNIATIRPIEIFDEIKSLEVQLPDSQTANSNEDISFNYVNDRLSDFSTIL